MKYDEFYNRVIKLNNDIVGNENIDLYEKPKELHKFTESEIQQYFSMCEEDNNLKLPDYFKEILFSDHYEIYWKYTINNTKKTGGELLFWTPMEILVNTLETDFSDKLTNYGKRIYQQGYRLFDGHPHTGDGIQMAIQIKNGSITDRVWYVHTIHEEMWPLELNYGQYIEHSLYLKGMFGWQYLFIDKRLDAWGVDLTLLGQRLADYPKLFPGTDISQYLKIYKDKGGK